MRIALLNQFYPPATAPTGQALQDLARVLAARGHEVHVLCARGAGQAATTGPEEREDRVTVHRLGGSAFTRFGLAGKLAGYGSFAARLGLAGARVERPEVIVALTTPPYLGLLASRVPGWRRAARVDWVMDVYPDVLAAHGLAREGGAVYRVLRRLAHRQYEGAAAMIALGRFMAGTLEGRLPARVLLTWVPLWGEAPMGPAGSEAMSAVRRARGWTEGETVLLYSGNMGRGHRLSEFLEAAGRLGPKGPRWAFLGGGFRRAEAEAFARTRPDSRVQVLPYEPRDRLRASLSAADVHLASLSRPWQGLIVPSKVQAAFSVGRPVLFVGPRENESAAWIEQSGGGWVVGEGDVAGLLGAVEQAADPAERSRRGEAALAFAREHFDPARNTERIALIVEHAAR